MAAGFLEIPENSSNEVLCIMAFRLSLAAKLYAIFALFGLMTAAITVLSDYNARLNLALTEDIETANRAARILEVVKKWEAIVQSDDAEQFATFKKRIEQFVDFRKELVRRAIEINPAAGREWGDNDANRAVRSALNKDLEALSKVYSDRGRRIAEQTETNHQLSFVLTCLGGFALLLVVLGIIIISRSIAHPLSA